MADFVSPGYILNVNGLNGILNNDIGRRFARTTRSAARLLLEGTKEPLRTGNETDFSNAYLQYSGQQTSSVGINDGAQRADVLRRVIMCTCNPNVVVNVGQNELSTLGSRLQTSSSIARSDHVFDT